MLPEDIIEKGLNFYKKRALKSFEIMEAKIKTF